MFEQSFIYFFYSAGLFLSNFLAADLAKSKDDSWIKSSLDGIHTEILGSVVDRNYNLVKNNLKNKFPRWIRDNSNTLYKSIRHSQLQAVLDICGMYRGEIKETKSEKYNLEYIKEVEKYLRLELAKLTQGDFVEINVDENQIKQLLLNGKISQKLQTDTNNALIKELPKSDILPTRFVEILQHRLLERFEAHFETELAKPEVANVFFKRVLSEIQFSLDELLEGQAQHNEDIENLRKLIESKTDKLEQLGYRILREGGKVSGVKFSEEKSEEIAKSLKNEIAEFRNDNSQLHQEGKQITKETGEDVKAHFDKRFSEWIQHPKTKSVLADKIKEIEEIEETAEFKESEFKLIPYKKSDKWGFCDSEKKIIVEPKYIDIRFFNNEMACVKLEEKYGFINKNGDEITPFKYDFATPDTEDGIARVIYNEKIGFIDKTGKEFITPKYYSGDYCFAEGLISLSRGGKCEVFNKSGELIIPPKYDEIGTFNEGLAPVKLKNKFGFINNKDEEVIPIKYDGASSFWEGLARVFKDGWLNGNGFIDKNNNLVVPFSYSSAQSFSEGFAWVSRGYEYSFIDKTGKEIIPFRIYDTIYNFKEGMAGIIVYKKESPTCGFIDNSGYEVIEFKYELSSSSEYFHEGLACMKLRGVYGEYGFIDKTGYEIIPFKYAEAKPFSEDLACVKLNGKYGFIDKKDNEIIQFKYNFASSFKNGLASVILDNNRFYISKDGAEFFED